MVVNFVRPSLRTALILRQVSKVLILLTVSFSSISFASVFGVCRVFFLFFSPLSCGVVVCSAMFCYVASNRVLRVVELSSFLLVLASNRVFRVVELSSFLLVFRWLSVIFFALL